MRRIAERIEPIRKQCELPLAVEEAFDLFTARLDSWWPLGSHSIAGAEVERVRFEPFVGGRVVEVASGGTEHSWADVLAWDPPHRFALSWHPTVDAIAASIVEVTFTPTSRGSLLTLEHGWWEEFGDDGHALRAQYDPGWDMVLAPLEQAALARA